MSDQVIPNTEDWRVALIAAAHEVALDWVKRSAASPTEKIDKYGEYFQKAYSAMKEAVMGG